MPVIASCLYTALTLVILLPITTVYLMYMVLAPVAGYPALAILIPLCFALGFIALWRLFALQRKQPAAAWPRWIKVGCGLMAVASLLFLVGHSMDALYLDSTVAYYYGATPLLYLALAYGYSHLPTAWHPVPRPVTKRTLLSVLAFLAALIWFVLVASIIIAAMTGALTMHGFETIMDLFTPVNLLNWIMIALLAAPGMLLLNGSRRLRRSPEVAA